jgi:hypothetical protein
MAKTSSVGTHPRLARPTPRRRATGFVLLPILVVMTAASVAGESAATVATAPTPPTAEDTENTPAENNPPAESSKTATPPVRPPENDTARPGGKDEAQLLGDPKPQDHAVPAGSPQLRQWIWPTLAALVGISLVSLLRWWVMRHQHNEHEATAANVKAAFTDFLDLFFGPMVEDGKLASHEFAPLAAAYFGLSVEPSSDAAANDAAATKTLLDQLRLGMQQRVKDIFGLPVELREERQASDAAREQLAKRLVAVWRRVNCPPAIHRLTLADRKELLRWIENTLVVWNQTNALEDLRANAATQSDNYLREHIGTHLPNDGDRKRVRGYFTAAERLLAKLHPSDESDAMFTLSEPSSASIPSPVDRATNPADVSHSASTATGPTVPREKPAPRQAETAAAETVAAVEPARSTEESPAILPSPDPLPQVPPEPEPARLPLLLQIDLTAKYESLQPTATAYAGKRCRELRDQAKDILQKVEKLFGDFSQPTTSPLAFSTYRSLGTGHVAVVADAIEGQTGKVWFLGDIHGDLLALDSAIDYIDGMCPDATIVFLGDLFDDEGFGYEVVLRVFQLVAERPGRIGYIVGNHDVSLNADDGAPVTFSSSVSPSDFADFLNANREDPVACGVGLFAIRFFRFAPRAIFLPDGLVVVHGGVPLGLRFPSIAVPADLERAECLQDFVWTRAHERARKKIPNPTSKTSEFGFEDFSAFCGHVSTTLGIPANRMVRGHDHFEACHSIYERWSRNPCLTVNTLSRRLPRDPFGPFERTPCVARWHSAEPLEIHQLVVPAFLIQAFYGKQPPAADSHDQGAVCSTR